MSNSLRALRGTLPLLLVLAIALTFLVFFLRRAGLFSESVTLQIAPASSGSDNLSGEPPAEVTLEIITLLPKDAIPAIFHPEFVSANEANGFLSDHDDVIGVVIDGDARAYGTAFLSSREVVNDTVGGRAITVTW